MKLRYIGIGLVLILALAAIAIVGHSMYKSHARAKLFEEARVAYQANDLDKARTLLIAFTEKDKTREEVYKILAEIAEKQGNYGDAVGYWDTAAALNPLSSESIIRQARAAAKDTDVAAAFRLLEPLYGSNKLDKDNLFFYGVMAAPNEHTDVLAAVLKALEDQKGDPDQITLLRALSTMLDRKPDEAQPLFEAAAKSTQPDVRLTALRGLIALAMFHRDDALCEKLFKEALDIDAQQIAWPYAQYCLERGRPEDALYYLKKEVQVRPRNVTSSLRYAEVLTETGNAETLKELRETLTQDEPIYVELGAYIAALEGFVTDNRAMVASNINRVGRFTNRALYRLMDLTVEATAEKPDVPRIIIIARDYLTAFPTEATRKRIIALLTPPLQAALSRQDLATAGNLAEVLLETRELPAPQMLAALRTVLAARMEAKDITGAISAARALLQTDPSSEQAIAALVECLPQTGRLDEAASLLQRLPDSPLRRINNALILERQGKPEAALAVWKTVPLDTPAVRLRYATFLAGNGDTQTLEPVLKPLENEPEYAYDLAKIRLLSAYRVKDEEAAALAREALLATLAPNPKNINRYGEIGLLFATHGDLESAEKMWRQALRLDPKHRLSLVNLSNLLAARGEHDEALALAETAFKAYPDWEQANDCYTRRQQEAAIRADSASNLLREQERARAIEEERARLEKEAKANENTK